MTRFTLTTLMLSALLLFSAFARADTGSSEFMNFNYLQNLQAVGTFYDGTGGSNIPNYGVTFTNFYGLRSGGGGNFSADPTKTPIIFINSSLQGQAGATVTGTMNVAPGFSSGLNFFYTAAFQNQATETVTVWSGANGTGTVLATLQLSGNDTSCTPASYCNWTSVGITFSGTAHSVTFSGPAEQLGLGDITLGSNQTAVPEPSSLYLMATGLVGVSASGIRRLLKKS